MPGLWRPRPSKAEAKATPKRPSWRLQQTVSLLMGQKQQPEENRTAATAAKSHFSRLFWPSRSPV